MRKETNIQKKETQLAMHIDRFGDQHGERQEGAGSTF